MNTYAVTGASSGIGRQVAKLLRSDGHRVIGIDLRDGDVVADLSSVEGRKLAIREVERISEGRLDGAVMAAGMGPTPGRDQTVATVNVLGTVELLEAWRESLAHADSSKVVVFGSNSTTTTPLIPPRAVRKLINRDIEGAIRRLKILRSFSAPATYAASKIAVTQWSRKTAASSLWAGEGIRLNVIAPGPVMTPMLQAQLDGKNSEQVRSFPVPTGGFGDPGKIAAWVGFMLSPAADFMAGSVVFVDGGSDAFFRANDWPAAVPLRSLPRYLRLMIGAQRAASPPRVSHK